MLRLLLDYIVKIDVKITFEGQLHKYKMGNRECQPAIVDMM